MKHKFTSIGIILFFFLMLVFPKAVFTGASSGLLLWYQVVLPTLFPFLLVSNLLLNTGSIQILSDTFGEIVSIIFKASPNATFVIIVGFLCGYPMGAKMAADMVEYGYLSKDEGEYLLSFCNNSSPGFILNFVIFKNLKRQELLWPTMIILILAPMIVSLFTRKKISLCYQQKQMLIPKKTWNFKELDHSIMDSFQILIKVGGYIILFSVIIVLSKQFFSEKQEIICLLATLEVTNGVQMICNLNLQFELKYLIILALTAFGGWCSVAQTQCVIQKSGFRIYPYIIEKLAASATASLLGLIYLFIRTL